MKPSQWRDMTARKHERWRLQKERDEAIKKERLADSYIGCLAEFLGIPNERACEKLHVRKRNWLTNRLLDTGKRV
jgi:hypothetical protein